MQIVLNDKPGKERVLIWAASSRTNWGVRYTAYVHNSAVVGGLALSVFFIVVVFWNGFPLLSLVGLVPGGLFFGVVFGGFFGAIIEALTKFIWERNKRKWERNKRKGRIRVPTGIRVSTSDKSTP